MKFHKNIEFIILSLILFLSSSFYLLNPINIPFESNYFHKLNFSKKQPNIYRDKIDIFKSNQAILKGGYFYPITFKGYFSKFYNSSISNISTSNFWHNSIYNNDDNNFIIRHEQDGDQIIINLNYSPAIPIVSIFFESEDFFSEEKGIYVKGNATNYSSSRKFYPMAWDEPANFYKTGTQSYRKIFFSYFDKNGKHLYSNKCEARISGHATRSFPQKTLTIKASKMLGDKKMKFDFFNSDHFFKSIILRNGGNDNTKTIFRDAFMQSVLNEMGLPTSYNQIPVEVFLNGEYWGIHLIQNKFDDNFIAEKFQVKEKDVTIVENWKREKGSEVEYNSLMRDLDLLHKNFSYSKFCELFDIENFTLYLAGEIFFANTDWPKNNIKMYKIRDKKTNNSKWNFAFFDLDYGLGYTGDAAVNFNMFDYLDNGKDRISLLYQKLIIIPKFKAMLNEKLNKFKSLNKTSILFYKNAIEFGIERHTERWRKPIDKDMWEDNILIIENFLEKRIEVIKSQIKDI